MTAAGSSAIRPGRTGPSPDEIRARVAEVFGDLPILESTRLRLRRISSDDLEDVFAYASDPEVTRYVAWDAHKTSEDSRSFITWALERYTAGEVGPWGVVVKENGRLIGTCGYANWFVTHRRAEIGFAIGRPYWNQGFTTEAVREVLRFGFERMKLNRIQARCEVENAPSERVMQKVGMTFEGVLRDEMFVRGRYRNLKMYSILKREWERPKGDGRARIGRENTKG